MKKTDWSLIALWIVVLLAMGLIVSGVIYFTAAILTETAKVLVGAAGALIAAVFSHALTEAREIEQRRRQAMQSNYEKLLERIGSAIRSGGDPTDEFSSVHLQSWVFGTPEVVRRTVAVLEARDKDARRDALKTLLQTMREDIGLKVDKELPLVVFKPRQIDGV